MTELALPPNLKNKRKLFGWTQEKAAEKISEVSGIEIKRATYRTWEAGEAQPPIRILTALVEVFMIDDLYLFLTKCKGN